MNLKYKSMECFAAICLEAGCSISSFMQRPRPCTSPETADRTDGGPTVLSQRLGVRIRIAPPAGPSDFLLTLTC